MSLSAGNNRKLYLAYGSNLNKVEMRKRCPSARPVGKLLITQARLVFRSVADVMHDPNARVPVGVWSITRECEMALDRYEGAGCVYERYHLRVGDEDALMYMMNDRGIAPPGSGYLDIIRRGYDDFDLDHAYLDAALDASFSEKRLTDQIRDRRERNPARHGIIVPNGVRPVNAKDVIRTVHKTPKPRKAIPAEQRVVTAPAYNHNPWGASRLIKKGTK
jgi:hypothetical protein